MYKILFILLPIALNALDMPQVTHPTPTGPSTGVHPTVPEPRSNSKNNIKEKMQPREKADQIFEKNKKL